MRLCCKAEEGPDRRNGGWSVGAGVAVQGHNQRHSDYHMSLMNQPNMHNIHPDIQGCGLNVGMNNGGCDGNMRSPIGAETGGGRTPL